MTTNRPKTIPEAYKAHEDLEQAYSLGWRHGHGCAACNIPAIGDKISPCIDWVGLGDEVDADNIREYHDVLAHAGADNSRQYSPFEFTAHEFNEHPSEYSIREDGDDTPSAEACWEAFEEGTTDAIRAELAEFTSEDYGITPDEDEDENEQPEDLTGLDPIALINRLLDAYAAVDDLADMYMGSGDGTAEDRASQRRSNLTYISVQNAVLALMK